MKDNKELVILAGKGGGGSVTAEAVASAIGNMTSDQAEQALHDLGGAPSFEPILSNPTVVNHLTNPTAVVYLQPHTDPNDLVPKVYLGVVTENSDPVVVYGVDDPTLDLHAANKRYVDGYKVTVTGSTPSITPEGNTTYKCGEVSSLTISNPPAAAWAVKFTSGATATTLTMPNSVKMPDGFQVEANTRYEINVDDEGYAVVGDQWKVSST